MSVPRRTLLLHSSLLLTLLLSGCKPEPDRPKPIGEAFVAPITLNLRQELTPGSKPVAVLKHGDPVDIIQLRRRFVRIRTKSGMEGWTDSRQLMTPEQMDSLREFSERAAKLPSYGSATAFSVLNIHSEPNRQSPSFYQIAEGAPVEVIGHKATPRLTQAQVPPPAPLVKLPPPAPKKKKMKKEKKEPGIPPPPRPAAPKLPSNYEELSRSPFEDEVEEKEPEKKEEPAPPPPVNAPLEDWSLVRTKNGNAGWVLSRMISMSIPDEVAQYAEGARITSYFPLADVQDEEKGLKHNWLWTTNSSTAAPYDFDSFRVFNWNRKKHRYETAYIERRIEGYYPVEARKGTDPTFSMVVRGDDGQTYRKTYAFAGYRVTLAKKEPYAPLDLSSATPIAPLPGVPAAAPQEAGPERSWKDRVKGLLRFSK